MLDQFWYNAGLNEGLPWQDNSDGQYRGFRQNVPYLFILLAVHPVLRRLYNAVFSIDRRTAHHANGDAKGHASTSVKSAQIADARLNQRASFDLWFSFLFLAALHGFSALKIFTILYLNYKIAKSIRREYIPVASWVFNISMLFANELCRGYRYADIAAFVLPWSGSTANNDWGKWLDSYGGLIPRWEVLFNITVLRLISFNLDYYWSLGQGSSSTIEVCLPLPSCFPTSLNP